MTIDRALLQQALDALEDCLDDNVGWYDGALDLQRALRARLAQPEQEPVVCNCNQGQSCQVCDPPQPEHDLKDMCCECCGYLTYHREHMSCIRAANTPQRQPLTDDEIVDMWATLHYEDKEATVVELARAVEAAHNIK